MLPSTVYVPFDMLRDISRRRYSNSDKELKEGGLVIQISVTTIQNMNMNKSI